MHPSLSTRHPRKSPSVSDAALGGLLSRLDDRSAKIAVVGQGYVGLSIAVRASELGFRVIGYDTSAARVQSLRDGRSFVDDVSDEQIHAALNAGYWPTGDPLDLRSFDVGVITVPTPLRDGVPDLSFIEATGRQISHSWLIGLKAGTTRLRESNTRHWPEGGIRLP